MKILLVRPHTNLATSSWLETIILLEPYALEIIAAAVSEPHTVEICDLAVAKHPYREFSSKLKNFAPDLVGFGGFSSQFNINKKLAKITKELLPQSITCLGGVHPSSVPADCKYPELFNLIIRGDGVTAIKLIITALDNDEKLPETDWILHPASLNFDEFAAKLPPPLQPESLNVIPRRDLIDPTKYFCLCYGEKEPQTTTKLFPEIASVRTSIGCPNKCKFCAVHFLANGKYVPRAAEVVVDEIAATTQDYIYFIDDETFVNTQRMRQIAELLLERKIKKHYVSWARSDTVCKDPELFALWKKAGLELVFIGFESLDEQRLDEYNKATTPSLNRQARQILGELNLNLHVALMVHPDFSASDFLQVQQTIKELAPAEFAFTVYSPPPGTAEYNSKKASFICKDPYSLYDCMHTILPTKLPLKRFYKYLAILYALSAPHNLVRTNKLKVSLKEFCRFLWAGIKLGWVIKRIYRKYDRKYW